MKLSQKQSMELVFSTSWLVEKLRAASRAEVGDLRAHVLGTLIELDAADLLRTLVAPVSTGEHGHIERGRVVARVVLRELKGGA